MQKLLKKIPLLFLLSLHFIFLGSMVFENRNDTSAVIFLLCIAAFLGIFYFRNFREDTSVIKRIDLILIIFSCFGALLTYALNVKFELGVVLSAGIVGLISSLIPMINRKSDLLREVPAAVYCGAFAGMTAPMIAQGYAFIALSGLFTGVILITTKTSLNGFGGKLGTIAFGGVTIMSLILLILN